MELLNQNLEQEEETAQMVGQSASQLLQVALKRRRRCRVAR
jgi:ferritin-like metal-binding protein YciE